MAVPLLPQELLELIIDAVSTSNGITPLKTLSRVSKAWRPRSQNNIFKKLILNCATLTRIRSETVNETTECTSQQRPPIVFSYVRKLRIVARQVTSPEDDGEYLEVLRFFTNVTSLRILDWDFREFETQHVTRFLAHFGSTVRTLRLRECHVDSEVLIFLISLFPSVNKLEVDPRYPCSSVTYKIQKSDRPSGSVEFRGNLTLRFLSAQHEEFLAFVSENSSDVQSISAELCVKRGELQRLFDRRGGNLTSVGIHSLWKQGEIVPATIQHPTLTQHSPELISLSPCTQLRTLSIHLLGDFKPDDPNWDALLTVNSPYLEEIRIRSFDGIVTSRTLIGWEGIDDILYRHYERSRQNGVGNFRVSLHPTDLNSAQEYAVLLLCVWAAWPKFTKEGTVTLPTEQYGLQDNRRALGPCVV